MEAFIFSIYIKLFLAWSRGGTLTVFFHFPGVCRLNFEFDSAHMYFSIFHIPSDIKQSILFSLPRNFIILYDDIFPYVSSHSRRTCPFFLFHLPPLYWYSPSTPQFENKITKKNFHILYIRTILT